MSIKKVTPTTLREMKEKGEKINLLVVYDYPFAKIADECGVDVLLVGDSLGTVVMGRKDDFSVTVDEMIHHTRAVVMAAERAMVVADMPFMSYHISVDEAKRNAGRFLKEGGADAVKLEGGVEVADIIRALVSAGIPVMGHIGLIGQALKLSGVRRVRGRTQEDKEKLLKDAKAIEEAGVFLVGLESMTAESGREISQMLKIPTNGIGAGAYCDGQGLNLYDIVGLTVGFEAKFVKRYINVRGLIVDSVKQFVKEAKEGSFPDDRHSYQ